MGYDELVSKLRKAGVDVSLVSRVQDEVIVNVPRGYISGAVKVLSKEIKREADILRNSVGEQGYLETFSGARRRLCRKPTLDDNNTLR